MTAGSGDGGRSADGTVRDVLTLGSGEGTTRVLASGEGTRDTPGAGRCGDASKAGIGGGGATAGARPLLTRTGE
jgi:hypothetical protein